MVSELTSRDTESLFARMEKLASPYGILKAHQKEIRAQRICEINGWIFATGSSREPGKDDEDLIEISKIQAEMDAQGNTLLGRLNLKELQSKTDAIYWRDLLKIAREILPFKIIKLQGLLTLDTYRAHGKVFATVAAPSFNFKTRISAKKFFQYWEHAMHQGKISGSLELFQKVCQEITR